MSVKQSLKSKLLYDVHARKLGAEDLQRQVRRTIRGKPIGQDQVDMIVTAIELGLDLRSDSYLLELACGNAALSQYLLNRCAGYVGVDISECLIDVARARFGNRPLTRFVCDDVCDFLLREDQPEVFTRVLCYAAFQYFTDDMIVDLLKTLNTRFLNVDQVFIGNIPDFDRVAYLRGHNTADYSTLKSNETPIGIWRSQDEIRRLCWLAGWASSFCTMPKEFYASAYRFDVILRRQ
jgi:hypothetical protein